MARITTSVRFDPFPLRGGLDMVTPQLSLKPGVARDSLNWECSVNDGYTRIPGYERYDGRLSPSAASYGTLTVTSVAGLAVGDAINGQTTGTTAVVAAIDGLVVVYSKLSGTFAAAENLRKGVTVIGVITNVGAASTDQVVIAGYQLAAANLYRADITAVPGFGSVLGVFNFQGTVYAWRNDLSATSAVLYKSTSTGWAVVPLFYELSFTLGAGTQPAEGATITKGAVSAVLKRVVLTSGSFAGSNAAGRLIIAAPTGGNFSAGAFTAGMTASCSGVQTAISFAPSGRFEHTTGNAGNGVRVYGCDGVNRGFEFDGTVLVPITTGMVSDSPSHVLVHKRHLFFSFLTSAQHAGVGTPYVWSAVLGAAELAVNQNITGFLEMPGDTNTATMAILSNDTVSILYGTGIASWNLVEQQTSFGCKAYAAQTLNQSYVFDDTGLTTIEAVQRFGNFSVTTLTANLRPFIQSRRSRVVESLVNHEKSQYRVFFSDGYALYTTIVNGQLRGTMPMLFPNPVTCACNGEAVDGVEVSYFGSTNGMVYSMDVGTSFDGAAIDHSFDLVFASQANARIRKRYRKAVFEVQSTAYVEFSAGYTLAWGSEDIVSTTTPTGTGALYWDSGTWDQFSWDGRALAPSQLSLEGSAENIALRIEGSSALWPTFTVNSITLQYTPRRVMR